MSFPWCDNHLEHEISHHIMFHEIVSRCCHYLRTTITYPKWKEWIWGLSVEKV
jgi:hypothetical protein